MTQRHRFTPYVACAFASVAFLLGAPAVAKSKLESIYQSTTPGDYLIGTHANADGSVFVITTLGPNNSGQILLLTPQHKKYVSSIIKVFACDVDGGHPGEALAADAAGNVWGMSNGCGGNPDADPQGTLFELVKPQSGGHWTFKTVAQMPAAIGNIDIAGSGYRTMVFDKTGNMYGLATLGCIAEDGCGKIFKVPVDVLDGAKSKGKIKILYTFPTTASQPNGMVRDKKAISLALNMPGAIPSIWAQSGKSDRPPQRTVPGPV